MWTRQIRVILQVAGTVLFSWAMAAAAQIQQAPAEDPHAREVIRMLQDVSRALQAGNPSSFLRFFDRKRFSAYPTLESHIVALTTQSDVASSIEVVEVKRDGDTFQVRLDWLLDLKVKETPGPLESRREVLRISAAEQKPGVWRVISLEPVNFFQPQDRPQP